MARSRFVAAAATTLVGGALVMGATSTPAAAGTTPPAHHGKDNAVVRAHLHELNDSGVYGRAKVHAKGNKLDVKLRAYGLVANAPHAMHIHYGDEARNECPTLAQDDSNKDGRLTTLEGVPAYGPIAVSLTTRGDTSPASGLAVKRFPTAPRGVIKYNRHHIHTSSAVADAIREGEGVVVIHGVDYNHNGVYDFGAGKSELDPSLPAEATNTAACGVLR